MFYLFAEVLFMGQWGRSLKSTLANFNYVYIGCQNWEICYYYNNIMNHNVYYKKKLFNLRNNIRSLYHFTHIIVWTFKPLLKL